MTGLESLDSRVAQDVEKLLATVYPPGLCSGEAMEDMILATPERENYSSIGTDTLRMSRLMYLLDNIFWLSVCLFVNKDFRECFHDAILIEKALLQVTETEYEDFREDMVLDGDESDMGDKLFRVNLARYNGTMEVSIQSKVESSKQRFHNDGMTDAYYELADGFDRDARESVAYVIHNLLYMVNAMDKNGVFNKYVRLVVDSVREQLSRPAR